MSSRSARLAATAGLLGLVFGTAGCWEQWSPSWFPQMKRQPAVQAFEYTGIPTHPQGFSPAEGSVPVEASEAPVGELDPWMLRPNPPGSTPSDAEANALVNPQPADFKSLANGKAKYDTFCAPCHGVTGLANGPVSKVFLGVLPLVGVVKARSDGHIFTTIRYGRRRMPPYARIPAHDRWDIVNYVRYIDQKGGQP